MIGKISVLSRRSLAKLRQTRSCVRGLTNGQQSQIYLHSSATRAGFFETLKKNVAEEQARDEKLKKARLETQQQAQKIGKEFDPTLQRASKIKDQSLSEMQKRIKQGKEQFAESEYLKKASEKMGKIGGDRLKFKMQVPKGMDPRQWEQVKDTAAIADALGQGMFGVLDIDPAYKRPAEGPRKRHPEWLNDHIEVNEADTGVKLHADSIFKERLDSLKDNRVMHKMADLQARMESSDSKLARGAMMFIWKMKEGLNMNAETSYTVEVIQRMEPGWTQSSFCEVLTDDFLPNILEACCLGEEEIVEDWCTEKAAGVLLANKKMAAQQGLSFQRHVYALSGVEFVDASMDEDTEMPTVMVQFSTQEKVALINKDGEVVDGSIEKPMSQSSIMVFARDMEERNPRAAWRVIEVQSEAKPMSF